MGQKLVVFIQFQLMMVQALLVLPLSYLLAIFVPSIRKRIKFELEEQVQQAGPKVDLAFEVSSEGELEQIKALLIDGLSSGKIIQLIYSSSSLNGAILNLSREYPDNFYWMRLPLLTYFPIRTPLTRNIWGWLKASKLVFCRYDFFPELLVWAGFHRAVLVSATLKNKNLSFGPSYLYKKYLFGLFEQIFTGSRQDLARFDQLELGERSRFFDFRQIQIIRRLENLKSVDEKLSPLLRLLENFPKEKRILFGSFWPCESSVFSSKDFIKSILNDEIFVGIAPHKLGPDFLELILDSLKSHSPELDPTLIKEDGEVVRGRNENLVISLLPGVLCETYGYFGHTFVGGGHGRSVHSLLEPYLAGSRVFCGPKVHRSTEYDLIKESSPESIHIVREPVNLYETLLSHSALVSDGEVRVIARGSVKMMFDQLKGELNAK